nr:aldolase catalytic domain-containing protein [uncultured Gemmiger sp.]
MANTKLLDCTLRDGGYVNNWRWGFSAARDIIATLTRAGVDIVEVGFLRNVDQYDPDVTVCRTIEQLNRLLPEHTGHTMYSGMAMRSNYDISQLSPYEGHGIEMIRITAHDYDIREGMDFAREVKARGYKLSINPINIMGYADKDILWILDQVNAIHPYQFSIVDTFGSMRRRDLERIVSLVDHNLDPDIRVGLHLHENMALSFCLAQEFLDKHLLRDTTVDASLLGMGRIPGNLPIELVADYMNENLGMGYDIDELMDAIQDHIAPLKGETQWGYTPAYFLSARYNLHRNYAEHFLGKGDLTNRDINHILAGLDRSKATVFDAAYADGLYREYQSRRIDDAAALDTLHTALSGKTVLVLAPGASLGTPEGRAAAGEAGADVVISANFCPEFCTPDYAFFSSSKRYDKIDAASLPCPAVLTSNLRTDNPLTVNYDRLCAADAPAGNSVLMLLRLLRLCGASKALLAGADGYREGENAYAEGRLHTHTDRGAAYNAQVAAALRAIQAGGLPVEFVTPSEYAKLMNA